MNTLVIRDREVGSAGRTSRSHLLRIHVNGRSAHADGRVNDTMRGECLRFAR
ncbi:MAG: hypothetical protein R2817_13040 [Flavobacteriales bacterium]